ncbi:MAG: hypothetical protein Q9184_000662 [Pyrenodesmia sp. 2 TL-2023]
MSMDIADFMGDLSRANVGTSRQQEALYIIGQHSYWFSDIKYKKVSTVLHQILKHMQESRVSSGRPPFMVHKQESLSRHTSVLEEPGVELSAASQAIKDKIDTAEKGRAETLADLQGEADSELRKDVEETVGRELAGLTLALFQQQESEK